MSNQTTTQNSWPPTDAAGLARVLHSNDCTEAGAQGICVEPDWENLSGKSQVFYLSNAEKEIEAGIFIPGAGWAEEFR